MSMWTEEHRMLRDTVRRFVDNEINPFVDEWEEAGIFPAHELFKKAGNLGLLGLNREEKYGGSALDYSFNVAQAEELGHIHCGGIPMALGVHTDMCTPALAQFGSDALKREYLAPSISGDVVGCVGVSEAVAGSDVARIQTRAVRDGDDYVINGSKMWITNGIQADWMCALVNTSEGHPHTNKSLVIIPMDAPGVSRVRKLNKLGMRSSDTAEIYFDDVRIPVSNRIGDEGAGFMYQMLQFQEERLWAGANTLIGLDNVVKWTVDYTRQRQAFKKSILDNQVVHFRLAELSCEIEALRSLVYRATERYVAGENVTRLASMAKLKSGRLAREVTDSCLQYWGGMGFMWETKVSRAYRDTRLISIGGGADEIMLSIICKIDGTLPEKKR
ncbi:MAG: citronellyl-CoA dehydrogenase [Myxococcota bacterium]|jgi:citronellyl-CoA dehydrogenase